MTKCIVLTQPYVGSLSYTMLIGILMKERNSAYGPTFTQCVKSFLFDNLSQYSLIVNDEKNP